MKKFIITFSIIFGTSAYASSINLSSIICNGFAENGEILINEVKVQNTEVSITYSLKNQQTIQKYVLTEKNKNGTTDINNQAYFIGATKSGNKNDYEDMSLPHLGLYKNGLQSEIAFNINGNRVFGVVSCQ